MRSLQLHSAVGPCYFYYFRYQRNLENSLGVSHGDDVFLIYKNMDENFEFEEFNGNLETTQISSYLVDLYGNFSLTNLPIYATKEIQYVESKNVECIEIFSASNFSLTHKENDFGNVRFWKSLKIKE